MTPLRQLAFFENLESDLQQLLSGADLENPVFHSRSARLSFTLHPEHVLDYQNYTRLKNALRLSLHVPVDLEIAPKENSFGYVELRGYLKALDQEHPELPLLKHPSLLRQGQLVFAYQPDENPQALEEQTGAVKNLLKHYGFEVQIGLQEQKQQEERTVQVDPSIYNRKPERKNEPRADQRPFRKKKTRMDEIAPLELRDLESGMQNVVISGHVFDLEIKTFKNNHRLQLIYLSDYEDAFILKRFENRTNTPEMIDALKVGAEIRVMGDVSYDEFMHTNVLTVTQLEEIEAPKRMDTADEKRLEFHVHSNFSEMDGVCSIEQIIQTAWDWGMDGIGISDHAVVQAFPMAQHKVEALLKKDPERKFKLFYGCEMYMVEDGYRIVYNNDHRDLGDQEYVVFDVETTGLSNRFDDLIEFGGVIVKNQNVEDSFQFFIDPKRSIPPNITELTHIQNSDVAGAGDFAEHYEQLKKIFKDRILVAHNASFDIGMINAACRKFGFEEFTNPVIDTRDLAYAIKNLKGYRLGHLAKSYDVPYDGAGAHRADYDARVLSYVFLRMLKDLGDPKNLDEFEQVDQSQSLRKLHPSHIQVFAKNQQGIKDLFELVTLSHTTYLSFTPPTSAQSVTGYPRIPRSVLKDYHKRGNLIFSSSCQNSEIFEIARNRSHEELVRAMDFYDVIEVQPPAVYKNLVDTKSIASKSNLYKVIRYILDAAAEAKKMVIATGDVHYIHPHQKRIRDIYINARQIGNVRHPLYYFNSAYRQAFSSPDQHLLSTTEMLEAFDFLGSDVAKEIVLDNPRKLSESFEICLPMKDRLYPPDIENSDQKLRDLCYQTAIEKYGSPLPEPIEARLNRELDAIIGAGYYVVYYISHLLVKKSNEDGYLVGSRGSVGSSLVATMSGITEVNPLPAHYICPNCHHLEWNEDKAISSGYDLPDKKCPECGTDMLGEGQDIPFETFLGFEGDKVPDIDLNFSGEYQAQAHAFTKTIFGDDHVFRAGTVGTVQEKTAYGYVKGYEEAMELEPFSEAKRVDLAKGAEGVKRTTGQHPGGIVVVPQDMDVHDFTPVQYPANNPLAEWKTTHFDFHQIHDNILKFDILGHVDPTAMKMLERLSGLDVTKIPMNDPETMEIFSSVDSLKLDSTTYPQVTGAAGIPEFGTSFVRGILELTRPKTFAELVSISGLSHGTDVWLNNAKDLIDNNICKLKDVIGCRDDIMLDLIKYGLPSKTAFTIMESVRKGKGLKEEWEQLMRECQVPEWYIDSCKKIKYMFPKAHAVAYVTMAIRIAWFKVHMPLLYYCQFFSIRCDAYDLRAMIGGRAAIEKKMHDIDQYRVDKDPRLTDKDIHIYETLELALEMTARGFKFSKMSLQKSQATEFCVDPDDEKALIPPFSAVDGLGESVAQSIVEARKNGEFLSKQDLLKRTSLSRSLLDKLEDLGALNGLENDNQIALF